MKRKSTENSGGGGDDWLTTYSDSVTLLMAFFVVLLSISTVNQSKLEEMKSGLDQDFLKITQDQPFSTMQDKLEEVVKEKELEEYVQISTDPMGVKINFASHLLYNSGTATLKQSMIPILDNIAMAITQSTYTDYIVKVEGHTDNVPINTAQFPTNWELSAARASGVVRKLIAKGVDKQRVKATGLADSHPILPNIDPETGQENRDNQSKNRRVVMYIHRGGYL